MGSNLSFEDIQPHLVRMAILENESGQRIATGILLMTGEGDKRNWAAYAEKAALENIVQQKIEHPFSMAPVALIAKYGYEAKQVDRADGLLHVQIKKSAGVVQESKPTEKVQRLKGRRICLDPGHGGSNQNVSPLNPAYKEKDMTLKVALALKPMLEEEGATVYLSRDKDMELPPAERTKKINAYGAELVVSIHTNAGGGNGAEVIYSIYSDDKLAKILLEELCSKLGVVKRKVFTRTLPDNPKKDYYFMIRDINCQSVITEGAFHDNSTDLAILMKPDAHIKYAEALRNGLVKYFNS
ncbi:N-acetylmuramoyl-L-alanine amidase [Brevibacillus agri]|uniref:N-acetylmuramoyl-L-alanine amidase family protein n=1 Tax=Brevibacillus agri TaxID=51101 RepID=UPI0025B70E9E|nr:N-acetylmuramoyl-L-alanine amidase [Brevibacillus agri]MDN4094337.1 N-acetylmuramoyl-L-alanine amidase [Brevibacillus agri]